MLPTAAEQWATTSFLWYITWSALKKQLNYLYNYLLSAENVSTISISGKTNFNEKQNERTWQFFLKLAKY
jgi:hypothetical protein